MSTVTSLDTVLATALKNAVINLLAVTAGTSFFFSFQNYILNVSRESDHKASECPNPRSAEGVECNKCGESQSVHDPELEDLY